jgi:hypothetical protein
MKAGRLVAAGFAAGLAIIKTVLAELDVEERLAQAAKLLAGAAVFGHFTLHAAVFLRLVGSGSHERSVTLAVVSREGDDGVGPDAEERPNSFTTEYTEARSKTRYIRLDFGEP